MDIIEHNRGAWNQQAQQGCEWSQPVSPERVAKAREGNWEVLLTPHRSVPRSWFPHDMKGARILGLASSGGQQMPLFAAAGADVTVIDLSDNQLALDKLVADREGLSIRLERGEMRDLSRFDDNSFDLVFHPVSNCFVPELKPVWQEAFRVLRPGGELLAGFVNPAYYIFDYDKMTEGVLEVRYRIPYSDIDQLSPSDLALYREKNYPFEYGHSLEAQLGGQLKAGFVLIDLYEDSWPSRKLDEHLKVMMATRARKP